MADDEESLSNVNRSFLEEKRATVEEKMVKEVIKSEEQCGFLPKLCDSNLSSWHVKDEVVATEKEPAEEEGREERAVVDRDEAVDTGLKAEVATELNAGGCEETVFNVIGSGQAGQETVEGILVVEGEAEALKDGGEVAVSDVGDLELGKMGGKELVPVADTKVEMVVGREELEASHGGEMTVSDIGDSELGKKGMEELVPLAESKVEMVVVREGLKASHCSEMAVSGDGDLELGKNGGEELVPLVDTKFEMMVVRKELEASHDGEMAVSDGDFELGQKSGEFVPVADSRVETVVVREGLEASDAKTETAIELEIGEREKFENEEVAGVEPMEFQMVESNTKVSIEDVINCKEKVAVELNDSEIEVADKVTVEEISTSKAKMEFGTTNESNSEVAKARASASASTSASAREQVHVLDGGVGVVGTQSLEAVYDEYAEDSLLMETQLVKEKDINLDVSKASESDEPANIAETVEEAVAREEIPAVDTEMETETQTAMEEKSCNLADRISFKDTKLAIESVMEIEKTNDDVGESGQELGDSLAAVQDEEDKAVVAEEEAGTHDTEMETDTGKVSGGKQKKGKKSKTPSNSRTAAKASGRKLVGDDVCFICFDGGDLVMCDRRGCPKAYHPSCVNRDEAFFKAKGIWNCGWHLCSICEKNAHYKCYTCAFSLCKGCIKDAVILCVRGNKGFCETCMRFVLLIENNEPGNEDAQIDFDDRNSWEYLFKDYYIELKSKLNLSSVEVAGAKNPWKGTAGTIKQESPEAQVDTNDGRESDSDAIEKFETRKPKRRKLKKQSKPPSKKEESLSLGATAGDECNFVSDNTKWASEELLEFVSHMKNGDTSVLSQFAVQALLLDYIKRNKLRDPRRKSQIKCDDRLENLFGKSRVGHFEMLKLLESHFLIKEDSPMDDAQGSVVDTESDLLEVDGSADTLNKGVKDRKRKMRKKGDNRAPQSNVAEYAAIDMHNISLIYLRRKLMEDLLEDVETFHDKVVGMFVRIRISGSFQKQDMYRLVQVLGTSKATEPYKIGKRTSDIMLEILNLNKTEIISIDIVSNQEFTEEECKRLRQSIKCGLISRLTVGDILEKAMEIQAARVNDWLESEILRLGHLRDRASDLGRRKELRDCVEKLQILRTPDERRRQLEEIPEIHADPKMDPSYESDDDGSETDESLRDAYMGSRGSGFSRRESGLISPGSDFSAVDSWSGAGKNSTKNWELSRNLSDKNISNDAIRIVEKVNENSWNQGRDRDTCTQESGNLEKLSSTTNSESLELNVTVSAVSLLTSPAPLSAGLVETSTAVKINETEKMWLYQDPSGKVQGPFSIVQLRKWSNSGYFPTELRIWRTAEKQEDSILLTDALAGKYWKELPEVGNKLHKPHISSDNSAKTLETSLHLDMKRLNAEQKPVQNPNLTTEKGFGNDSSILPSPTLKQSNGGRIGEERGPRPGETQHPAVSAVLKSLAAALPQLRTDTSAASSVQISAAASSPAPNPEQGGLKSGDFRQTPKSIVTSEPHAVQMHGHLSTSQDMTVQPVQSVISRDCQVETRGLDSVSIEKVEPNASIPESGQHQAHGWGGVMSTVQNSTGNSSNSGITGMPQTDFWRPPKSGIQSNMQPTGMANATCTENANPGWGTMQANPNTGWGTPTPGSMNMNWVPVQVQPTGNATSNWVVPAGNSGATVQGPVSGNVHPGWVATPSWGAPNGNNTGTAVQLQGPVPGWGPPAGIGAPIQGPPVGMGATPPGNGALIQGPMPGVGAPFQGPPPPGVGAPQGLPTGTGGPLQGPPQGNINQSWGAPAGGQGIWGGQQNPSGGPFSGGFSGGRPWNGQASFGRGGPRPFNRRQIVCPYNGNGRCRKGAYCDYLHT
ncbi:zinc finger CCCH domain-containing protein 19-like isoform X1 [Olea europaea var. sylvestris]|uniref:Zinc finger CCCH domain-containing 19 isoform X1 n=1 Tax=Olea europaea subsp. europaea TaxID=158383 RepID=A0A8S0R602_OLEEU|nr:zinc finger CCCH domain-containing protein 19-like isoform X1 [Olea europaea var. sylvestris]CAA2974151.1 zinc finger CCCH domain-containing 19 isoform X1 [Olea europaea subsp. europaea]